MFEDSINTVQLSIIIQIAKMAIHKKRQQVFQREKSTSRVIPSHDLVGGNAIHCHPM